MLHGMSRSLLPLLQHRHYPVKYISRNKTNSDISFPFSFIQKMVCICSCWHALTLPTCIYRIGRYSFQWSTVSQLQFWYVFAQSSHIMYFCRIPRIRENNFIYACTQRLHTALLALHTNALKKKGKTQSSAIVATATADNTMRVQYWNSFNSSMFFA